MSLRAAFVFAIVLASGSALAQSAPVAVARAVIESVSPDAASLTVRTRAGDEETVHLGDKTAVTLIIPAALADVKPGAFIGVAALPNADGQLKALEVHVFPDAMRGTGEGHRPFDLAPGSTMTNGAVSARVDGVDGANLTVTYNGGHQAIVVDPKTPIVSFEAGSRADLKPGAAIVARGPKEADGSMDAARVLVGKDGLVPPL